MIVLQRLATVVKQYLEVDDTDFTISKFIYNIFQTSRKAVSSNKLASFVASIKENGGEDFPEDFVKDVFEIASSQLKEPKITVKLESDQFPGLSLPDTPFQQDSNQKNDRYIKKESPEEFDIKQERQLNEDFKEKIQDNRHQIKQEHLESVYQKSRNKTKEPVLLSEGNVYVGKVSNLTSYGAFIWLDSGHTGLCHVSQISFDGSRTSSPSDVLRVNQTVFVKVLSIQKMDGARIKKEKITLSMRGIDQTTGLEQTIEESHQEERLGRLKTQEFHGTKRRLTSPERWEISQLIAAGVASAKDYPELNGEDPNAAFSDHTKEHNDDDIEIEIELRKDEPKFLKGQLKNAVKLAPVEIYKNPEGSLSRSAMNGSKFAKEFKEEKLKLKAEEEREIQQLKAKSMDSHDPLAKNSTISKSNLKVNNFVLEWKKSQMKSNISYGKRTNLSMKEQRESLPIFPMRSEIVETVRNNQFLVIVGETGSGKTTQIVQYLYEEGFADSGGSAKLIGCTQPRRVAAESVAKRVAEEVGTKLGQEVGYTVRFDDNTSNSTRIKYMTDGMLEREAISDPGMSRYSVIMLDEAHERTISTDVLFALLKKATITNPNLKVIVTSATLDSEKFSRYFNNCPILKIPGRTFPVEILYTREPEMDYLAAVLDSVIQIHVSEPKGDILVFLTGQEEIETCCEALFGRMKTLGDTAAELIILPVYSALPSEMQSRIFEPTPEGSRKVVIATNIAETSITIDGIYYVIDPGFVKLNAYDAKLGMDSLIVSPISQAQANQRSGRAGRTGPGKCYRLYTEKAYNFEMLANTIPEIQRQNLSHTILMLKAMGINNLLNFEFMDPPPPNTMISALQDLYTLEALDENGYLTPLGRKMAQFPMEPVLAKTLLSSVEFGCSSEILTIVAMLSVQTIFYRPKDKQKLADQKKAKFHHHHGDHLTLLNVYRSWELHGYDKSWCQENFIQDRSMRRALEVRKQLAAIMRQYKHEIISCGMELNKVRRALTSGFFKNTAKRDAQEGYKTIVEGTTVSIHPSSALYGKRPEYVLYHTLLLTTKEYMNCSTVIEPKWLAELAPNFYGIGEGVLMQKKQEKITPLYDKFRQDTWRLSEKHEQKRRALSTRQQ